MGALTGANSGSPRGNVRSAYSRALREHPPRFLLDRYTAETRAGSRRRSTTSSSRFRMMIVAMVAIAYLAAMPAISTKYLGAARRASTVARAGGFAGSIHESHTLFMSSK